MLNAKSEAGWRTIPIHNDIKQVIARLIETATGQYLISGLSFNKYGDRSNAIGKRFGKLKKDLGTALIMYSTPSEKALLLN